MDWDRIINRQHELLLEILAALFVLTGIEPGGSVATMPRWLRNKILFVLRPGESSLRRLIYLKARALVVTLRASSGFPKGTKIARNPSGKRRDPLFCLFDKQKRFDWLKGKKRRRNRRPPQIIVLGLTDHLYYREAPKVEPSPDDLLSAESLCRRLHAMKLALEDIPKHAMRMARAMERRKSAPPGPGRCSPVRPGWPPGHRSRRQHPVDDVLWECAALVRAVPARRDSG